ncbi:MAG TPA: LysE family translocator [Anaerolineales bacterium]|nr:LysE family translocator [Anaerolineales bacterium]
MISSGTLLLYTIGALVIIVSPGPDFIYVTTRGIAQGRLAGLLSAAGISLGLMVHTTLAALGLSALLQTSGIAFQTIKFAGAAYLLYLGIRMFLNRESLIQPGKSEVKLNKLAIVRQGIATNVFNPKAIITFMAFIPQFINPADKLAALQISLLGGIIAFLAIAWFGLVGYFAGTLGKWLGRQLLAQRIIQWCTGCILVGLGLRLAFSKNR